MLPVLRERALREVGNEGADTLSRYFAQIQYTALWCIRMLGDRSIKAVLPETVEDVVIVRSEVCELRQVKTRNESSGNWTTEKVLPVLSKQYNHRMRFNCECQYHFISERGADTKTQLKGNSYGSLFRLKSLLNLRHEQKVFSHEEESEWNRFCQRIIPRIQELMGNNVDELTAHGLLEHTYIETDCTNLRVPEPLSKLHKARSKNFQSDLALTSKHLQDAYDSLLIRIVKMICNEPIEKRKIERQNVLDCCCGPIQDGSIEGAEVYDRNDWILNEYTQTFVGRENKIQEIDEFIKNNSSGMLLVTAGAGCGKTALLANWIDSKRYTECFVAYHFFSYRYDVNRSETQFYRNLLRQLKLYYRLLNSPQLQDGLLRDRIMSVLRDNPPMQDNPLIIVIDGLDEASDRFDPPFPSFLPEGLFVIISARAEAGERTYYLKNWIDRSHPIAIARL